MAAATSCSWLMLTISWLTPRRSNRYMNGGEISIVVFPDSSRWTSMAVHGGWTEPTMRAFVEASFAANRDAKKGTGSTYLWLCDNSESVNMRRRYRSPNRSMESRTAEVLITSI